MDLCHLKVDLCTPRWHFERWFRLLRSIYRARSASQVAAAKVMDVVARLPGWAGQAADAVSSYTQVKIEDAPTVLKIPRSECPDIWMRLARHKWPKSWSSMEDPVVPLGRNLFGHPLAGLLWERQLEKGTSIVTRLGKSSKLRMLVCKSRKRTILVCVCGRHKTGWKETEHRSNVESTDETSRCGRRNIIPYHVYLGCTQRECETSKGIVDNYK